MTSCYLKNGIQVFNLERNVSDAIAVLRDIFSNLCNGLAVEMTSGYSGNMTTLY